MDALVGCEGGLVGCVGCEGGLRRLRTWRRSVAKMALFGCDKCIGLLHGHVVFLRTLFFIFYFFATTAL